MRFVNKISEEKKKNLQAMIEYFTEPHHRAFYEASLQEQEGDTTTQVKIYKMNEITVTIFQTTYQKCTFICTLFQGIMNIIYMYKI